MSNPKKKYDVSYQAKFNILGFDTTVYIRTGLLEKDAPGVRWIHKHRATEVHIGKAGVRRFIINETEYEVAPGDLLVIPANTYHCRSYDTADVDVRAFQTDTPVDRVYNLKLDPYICDEYFKSIDEYLATGNLFKMATVLPVIYSKFVPQTQMSADPITDMKYVIEDFIYNHFVADTTLEDLAEHLHLSPKQANRLVQKHLGMPFKQALNEYRVTIADNLIATKSRSLTEIAEILGYQSYSGFWKMYSKATGKTNENKISNA